MNVTRDIQTMARDYPEAIAGKPDKRLSAGLDKGILC
jgi:hypothetical protein